MEGNVKVLSASQLREADRFTIGNEPVDSIDLMERAAKAFADWFTEKFNPSHRVHIFCGMGNNGGDGLAITRLLHQLNYAVVAYAVRYAAPPSKDFIVNEQRLKKLRVKMNDIRADNAFPVIQQNEIIVDGLWGSGLNRPVEGFAAQLIQHLNAARATRVAIDIPSGLYADSKSVSVRFKADFTLSFELPKLSFFLPENEEWVGEWEVRGIGLHPAFLQQAQTSNFFLTTDFAKELILPRKKFAHKGTYGHALIVSGSYGKMGAACLCAEACLRAGAGLVTAFIPKCGYEIMQTKVPEAMAITDRNKDFLTAMPELSSYKAVGIGPGIGTKAATAKALGRLIKKADFPLVLDADALNILSENKAWLKSLPENSILTPHPKEFERLFGKAKDDYAQFELLKESAVKYRAVIVLKRAYTCIASPDGSAWFNSTGNPGMATGGTGDVLTGIITGLLCQGYSPLNSALLGVYWHGLAGDLAAGAISVPCLVAGDIIRYLGIAFKKLAASG